MELTGEWTIPVGGKWPLSFTWKGDDLPTGVTIASATKTVSPATGLTVDSPVLNTDSSGVNFWVTAVTAGFYTIVIIATRSDGGKNVALGYVTVTAAAKPTTLAANALISVADLARLVGDDVSTSLAEMVINSVSQEFENEVGCDLFNATYTAELNNGNGKSFLFLPHWPITDIDAVTENDVTLTEDTDFYADYANGILWKMDGGKWTAGHGTVAATYDAGYAAVPADISLACAKQCAVEYQKAKQKGWNETSRSVEGGSVSLIEPGLLPDVMVVLQRYHRVRI